MKIISKLNICGVEYKIKLYKVNKEEPEVAGICYRWEKEIHLFSDSIYEGTTPLETLIHETMHALSVETGMMQEPQNIDGEAFIVCYSKQLSRLIPDILKIAEKLSKDS